MSFAAILKFVLLTVAAGFTMSALFKADRGRVIRSARYSVVSLLIGTLPILMLDQGRDLLLGLADPSGGRHQTWFVIWSVVWAFSVWYWSRVILDADAGAHAVEAVSGLGDVAAAGRRLPHAVRARRRVPAGGIERGGVARTVVRARGRVHRAVVAVRRLRDRAAPHSGTRRQDG